MRLAWGRERAAERPFPSFARSLHRQRKSSSDSLRSVTNPPLPHDDSLWINNNQQAEGVKASITEKQMALWIEDNLAFIILRHR